MTQRNTTPWFLFVATVTMVALFSVACQGTPPVAESPILPTETPALPASAAAPPIPTEEEEQPMAVPTTPSGETTPAGSQAETMVAAARAGLAQRLDVPEQQIVVKSVEAVQWPDASLGCPQPGMMYAQVIIPGFRVVLEVEGQTYEVHTDTAGTVALCEEEVFTMEVAAVPGTIEPGLESLIDQAKEDLAQRLSMEIDEIEVLEAKAVVWPDASLGCPQPGMRYKQVPMDGALIRLQAEGKVYDYHSGGGRDPFLCEQPLKLQKDTPPQLDLFKLTPGSPTD
jgi:hypothetical protein